MFRGVKPTRVTSLNESDEVSPGEPDEGVKTAMSLTQGAKAKQRRVHCVASLDEVHEAQDASDDDQVDLCWKAENAILVLQNRILAEENDALVSELQESETLRKKEADEYASWKQNETNESACLRLRIELMQSKYAVWDNDYRVLSSKQTAMSSYVAILEKENIDLTRKNSRVEEKCVLFQKKAERFQTIINDQSATLIGDTLEIDRLKTELLVQRESASQCESLLLTQMGELNARLQALKSKSTETTQLSARLVEMDARCATHVKFWEMLYDIVMCPVNHVLMSDPVVLANGMSFEKKAIEDWIHSCRARNRHPTCPLKRVSLHDTSLRGVFVLKQISEFITENAERMGISEYTP